MQSDTAIRNFEIHYSVNLLDLHLSIPNGLLSSNFYGRYYEFDFDTVNFPFFDVTFSILPLTGIIFLNLFDLLECLIMCLTSMSVTEF